MNWMQTSMLTLTPTGSAHPKRRPYSDRNAIVLCLALCYYCWNLSMNTMITCFPRYRSPVPRSANTIHFFCHGWTPTLHFQRMATTSTSATVRTRQSLRSLYSEGNLCARKHTILGFDGFRRGSSTKLFMVKVKNTNKWEVGDLVNVVSKNDEASTQRGEVISIRGSGWYTVRLLQSENSFDSDQDIIKCRGNQLKQLAFDINDGKVIPNHNGTAASDKINQSASSKTIETISDSSAEVENSVRPHDLDEELSTLPSPTIYDLDAGLLQLEQSSARLHIASNTVMEERVLRQAAHHSTYEKWVVFTDLHCSPATLDTCLEVLEIVHETAMKQSEKCGVLFLGDFWHHRGTLRVDCLNAILEALRSWQVPMIMIPGNHDQVTLGGDNHGLTPLQNAYRVGGVPGPLILSHPTRFRNALFVPHVRDMETMKTIVSSEEAHESSALFVHAEVKGALMNDMVVSTQGISPSIFPRQKHIYSGHFHKPHCVKTSSFSTIEYMGSPYQISLGEAHQDKQLVVLNSKWECDQRIPINVGRRHFKVSSLEELQQIHVDMQSTPTVKETEDDDCIRVKRGDRIVISVPKKEQTILQNSEYHNVLSSRVQSLREQGLTVEIREVSNKNSETLKTLESTADTPGFEEMSPESIWKAYLNEEQIRNSINDDDYDSLLRVGLGILEEIESSAGTMQSMAVRRDLRLTSTTVTGFGPFEDTIEYPLDNRGLVLLRGSNNDYGPDSNGTGKSSLAMATLWGLTGSLDARPASDFKVGDVVNDNSKVAKVVVEGFINDSPFVISRSKTASKGDLVFQVNDVDLTTQSVKETQSIIEEKLGVDAQILTRVAFYGQHGVNDLLEATDSKLKDELSLVVPLTLWQEATSLTRAKSRQAKKRVDEMEGMIKLRKTDIEALRNRVARAKEARDLKQRRLHESEGRLNHELSRIQEQLDRTANSSVNELQTELEAISAQLKALNDLYDFVLANKEDQLKPLENDLSRTREIVTSLTRKNNIIEMDARTSRMSLDSARVRINQIEEKWSLDLSNGVPAVFKPPEYCPTCNQPLQSDEAEEESNNVKNAQKTMETEIEEAHNALHSAEAAVKEAAIKMSECSKALEVQEKLLNDLQLRHQDFHVEWSTKLKDIQKNSSAKREAQSRLTSQISMVAKESQLLAQREALKASFNTEKLNVAHASEIYDTLSQELSSAEAFFEDIRIEKEVEENNQRGLSYVGERFGQRGVQTFIMQNAVSSLESTAQVYLNYLSDGSQRLQLSLDAGDKILRNAFVRGADGEFKQRPLSTLSGGQWRRCSLALSFAFAELVAASGRLRSSLLVLDEPLTHLDRSGRTKFGELVRKMLGPRQGTDDDISRSEISTAIVILQDLSAEELEESFDGIDTVVRKDGKSRLSLDDMSSS